MKLPLFLSSDRRLSISFYYEESIGEVRKYFNTFYFDLQRLEVFLVYNSVSVYFHHASYEVTLTYKISCTLYNIF